VALQPDLLLAQLERDIPDRNVPLSDLLLTCVLLAGQLGAPHLEEWANAELSDYPGASVPEYRRVRAPVMQLVEGLYGGQIRQPFDVHNVPDFAREYITEVLPLNQGVHELESMASQADARGRTIDLGVVTGELYVSVWNKRPTKPYTMLALYWSVDSVVIRGVLGKIRTALARIVAKLRSEIGASAELPSGEQADDVLRAVVGPAVINNVNIFTGNSQAGGIVTEQARHEYNFGDIKGNVAAGSSGFSQVYEDSFDVSKVREFADLIAEISGTLHYESQQEQHRADLEAGVTELRAAIEAPAADRGRIKRALDKVMVPLQLATSTAVQRMTVSFGAQLGNDLASGIGTAIHHPPH
jgi:AbiTii